MQRRELVGRIKVAARENGFRPNGTVLWTASGELVAALQLQASRFDSGLYVNTGVLPRAMITKPAMPGAGYWALGGRASQIEGPFREWFAELEDAASRQVSRQLPYAVEWLCEYVRSNYLTKAYIRAEAKRYPDDGAPDIMRDWLRGRLREPRAYWPLAPYYRHP